MVAAGVDEVAIETFEHYYRLLEHGETGMIPESSIEPVDGVPADVEVSDEDAARAIAKTVVIKLNGGLGTSMGLDRAKSLLPGVVVPRHHRPAGAAPAQAVRRDPAAHLHEQPAPPGTRWRRWPATATSPSRGCRWSSCRTRCRSCWPRTCCRSPAQGPRPRVVSARARRPLHRAARHRPAGPADRGRLRAGLRVQLRQPRRGPGRRIAGWFAGSGAPFAIEAVRRTPRTARAATSHAARTTAAGAARDRADAARRPGGAGRPSGTGSARPTTCGSTSRR